MDAVGEGQGGMSRESSIDIDTPSCVKHDWGKLLYTTGTSAWCSVMTWKVGRVVGERGCVCVCVCVCV